MKKAKIFLSAFSVLALVAGALAFKANKFTGTVYCSPTSGHKALDGTCLQFNQSTYGTSGTASFCTTSSSGNCSVSTFTPIGD